MMYLPKKFCVIIIYRYPPHILDMFCCHQHLQQRDQNENTKIYCYMYVDILSSLTQAIPIMFERVTTHYQTLQTWIGHNAACYHNFNVLLHALQYIFSHYGMALGYLQRVTTRYRQVYKNIYI